MIAYTNYLADGRVRLEAESLVGWGYEVCFLVPRAKDADRASTYTVEGVTIIELETGKYHGKSKFQYVMSYLRFLIAAFFTCTRLFLKSQINVVHVHNMPNLLVFAGLVPRLMGCNLVLDVHDTVPETYMAKYENTSRVLLGLLRLEELVSFSVATKLICVNHVQRDALIQRGIPAEKIVTILTMPRFASQHESVGEPNPNAPFKLVNHGTVSKRLGIDLIIRAVAQLSREIPNFEFHHIGRGDAMEEVKQLCDSLGLRDYVYFHPGVAWDKLPEQLKTMDAGIIGNRVNAATELMLPAKLIDYAVLDIPAIVPRLKGIEYYFTPEMVTYYEPENVSSIVEAVMLLYRSPKRREMQAVKARSFREKYSWDNPRGEFITLYKQMCGYAGPKGSPVPDPDLNSAS